MKESIFVGIVVYQVFKNYVQEYWAKDGIQ